MGRVDHMVVGLEFVLLVGIGRDFLGRNRGLLGGRGMRFGCGHFCFRWALSRKSARGMIISRQYGRNAPRDAGAYGPELVRLANILSLTRVKWKENHYKPLKSRDSFELSAITRAKSLIPVPNRELAAGLVCRVGEHFLGQETP